MERLNNLEMTRMDVPQFLWRHRNTLLGTFVFGMVLTLLYLAVAPRKYRSEAKVLVRIGRESITLDPTATTGQFVAMTEPRDSELHEVEELLASRGTAEKIVDQLGPAAIMEKKRTGSLGDRLSWLNAVNLNPLRVYSVRDKAVKALQKNLGISAGKKSNVLTVSYKASDPQHAHDVLEVLLTTAREDHARVHRTSGSQQFFENQRELLGKDLGEQEQRLREFKDSRGLASLSTQRDAQVGIITALRSDLLRSRAEQSAAQAEVDLRRKQLRDQPAMVVTEQTTGQPQTAKQTLREKLYELEVREQELAARLRDDAPQLVHIRTQIAEARRIMTDEQIGTETKKGLSQTHQAAELALQEREASLVALVARCAALDENLAMANGELKKLNSAELELNRIEREIDLARTNYRKYSENLEQVRIDQEIEAAKISSLNLMQPPTFSETPASPDPIVTLAMGACGSLLAGIGFALLRHPPYRKRRSGSRRLRQPAHENGSSATLPRSLEVAASKPR
jgi:uncharacterized protein involved in exopolysaccharide biosynthesis